MSKTWCPLPWTSQFVRNNGDLRVCSQANTSKSKGILKNKEGKTYNIAKDDLLEANNSETLKKIRLEMLEGKNPEQCIRCQKEEESGINSRRLYETSNWKNFISFEKAKEITNKNGEVDRSKHPIVHFDLRLGNRCNLKCRMCGPTDSDSWYADNVKVWGVSVFKDSHGEVKLIKNEKGFYKTKNKDYDWIESECVWQKIQTNISNIQLLHIVGGEPLLIEKHYETLEKIIEKGCAKNITLQYNSNLTVLPKKILNLWRSFKQIQIGVSVDGVGKINDYIRYPSRFEKIEGHLEKLDNSTGNYDLWIATTVQAYNIFYLPELIEWKLKKRFNKVNVLEKNYEILNLHPLHNPAFLNVKILPKKTKDEIANKFQHFLSHLKTLIKELGYSQKESLKIQNSAQTLLSSYLKKMRSEDWSHLIPKFIKYTKTLDQIREQKLEQALPELYKSLNSSGIEI